MDCTSVKPGWYCAGEAGHDGPCAAWPACYCCGYLGPGLEEFLPMTSICPRCSKDIRDGLAFVPGGDVTWDGGVWTRIKRWFSRGKA